MDSKILFITCVLGVCSAVIVDSSKNLFRDPYNEHDTKGYHKVSYHPPGSKSTIQQDTYYTYPRYEFEYAVSDKKTGDHKYHHESRDGHRVKGGYGLVESDGSLRKVEYDADDHNGFRAIVSRSTHMHGDNAVSMMEHARHFLPFGKGIKINYFFPKRNYETTPEILTTEKAPVTETTMSIITPEENDEAINIDPNNNDKNNHLESVNVNEEKDVASPNLVKMEPVEEQTKIMPTPIAILIKDPEDQTPNMLVKEPVSPGEEQKTESPSDAEVASSYYHSKIYYFSF